MPASSGDPISGVLSHSLSTSLQSSCENDSLGSKLLGSAKRVLLAEIKYEKTTSYSSSVSDLKTKYRVLRPGSKGTESNLVNGLSKKTVTPHKELKPSPSCNGNGSKEPANHNSYSRPVTATTGKCNATLPSPKTLLFPPEKVQLGWQSNFPVGAGMVNMGNTCYLNSTLQALFHVPAFVNWLLNDKGHKEKCGAMNGINNAECLVCAVQKTLNMTLENGSNSPSAIRPHLVYSKLKLICKRLMHGHQEDAHEFLRHLLESMDRSYLRSLQATNLDTYSKETSALSQIFGGYLRTEVRCLECRNISVTFQHFQDLLLDIRQSSTMEEALDGYFGRETLGDGGDETAYKCEKCHRRVAATKQFFVERPPNVLCVQLKRFGMMGGKNSKHIQVSQTLDLAKFWLHRRPGARLQYRLQSLVSHIGPSTNCGHYTAIGRVSSGHLYLFDDSMVRPVSNQAISGTNTYIIMYEITSPNPSLNVIPNESATGNCTVTTSSSQSGNSSTSKSADCTAVSSSENCSSSSEKLAQSHSSAMKISNPNPVKKPLNFTSTSSSNARNGQCSAQAGHKSLVPYSAESSDSESELTASKLKPSPSVSPVKNGSVKKSSSGVKLCSFLPENSVSQTGAVGVSVKSKAASDTVVNGWHVTPAANFKSSASPPHPNPSNHLQNSWNVVDSSNTKNGEINGKSEEVTSSYATSSCNRVGGEKSLNKGIENGNHKPHASNGDVKKCLNGVNGGENGRIPAEKSWNGHRNEETRSYLQSNSHLGYGSHVSTWNGSRTQVDREADDERNMQQKRSYSQAYDDDIDQGRVKQIKTNHYHKNNGRDVNGRRNLFQDHQNRKNNWYNNDRSHFYRTYSNNHYNRTYQNRNSNYHWRR